MTQRKERIEMAAFSLNPQQQEAVNQIQGPLLLLAGAGTGKTRVIVQRIDNMLNHGILASSILAVTFTNKAATEMKERVAALGNRKTLPTVSTFHSFCVSVLRAHADKIGLSRNFTIATEGYQKGLLRNIAIDLNLDSTGIDPYTWLSKISLAKAYMLTPDDIAAQPDDDSLKISAIYGRYQTLMRRMNLVDFDDLLTLTRELWLAHPDVLQSYQDRYRYIMVDEYQDTNKIQLNLIVLLAGKNMNVCAVGDDDQSIYGWRGANQENILEYEKFFPGTKIIRLEQNYRSTNTILKAANAVISHNSKRHEKNLWSDNGEGVKIMGVLCEDEHAEANFIADHIFNSEMHGNNLLDRHQKW
ncbi:MAG: UvrD-helicase domain-containing protein, partial [Victivallales bacterium]|nr:UvrD-helicase domain-containing protein [Victivallales bacterium]